MHAIMPKGAHDECEMGGLLLTLPIEISFFKTMSF